jgi:hypothetical protein
MLPWLLVAIVGCCLAICVLFAWSRRDKVLVSWANYHRIKLGMSREEVEGFLGLPQSYSGPKTCPGGVPIQPAFLDAFEGVDQSVKRPYCYVCPYSTGWHEGLNSNFIELGLNGEGKVIFKGVKFYPPRKKSWWQDVLGRLGL